MNQIVNDIGKGLKQLGQETVEKMAEEGGKIVETVMTAQELLGDIKPLSDEEMAQKKSEDEKKRQKEISDMKSQMSGRNVESEMKQLRQEKEKEEEEKEKYYQREKEEKERQRQMQMESSNDLMMESSNPAKQKKSRGSAFANKKKSQPDQSQMSQTSEFKGKIN